MRKLIPLIAASLVFGAAAAEARPRGDGEAQLARALEGRVAGEPVDCIDLFRARSTRIIPGTGILFEAGGTIYVNRPTNGAEELNPWDAILIRSATNRLCSIDTVQLVDPTSRILSGVVFLGEFVPYRRVRD